MRAGGVRSWRGAALMDPTEKNCRAKWTVRYRCVSPHDPAALRVELRGEKKRVAFISHLGRVIVDQVGESGWA